MRRVASVAMHSFEHLGGWGELVAQSFRQAFRRPFERSLFVRQMEHLGVVRSVEGTYDFKVSDVRIEVTGTCQACQQQHEKGK